MWRYPGTQQVSGWQLASLWAQNFCHSLVSFYNLHHRPTDTPGVRGGGWGRWGRGATTPGETPHSHSGGFGLIPDRTYGKKSGGHKFDETQTDDFRLSFINRSNLGRFFETLQKSSLLSLASLLLLTLSLLLSLKSLFLVNLRGATVTTGLSLRKNHSFMNSAKRQL